RELAEGWQVYQSTEVLRSVDDLQLALRSLVLQGWVIWLGFVLLSVFIMNQIIRTLVRPLRYLEGYFKRTNRAESIPLLFETENQRRESGVLEASKEIARLFDGIEKLIRKVREASDLNQNQLNRQKTRAEALASVSRDAVFFLKGNTIQWCNSIGSRLLEYELGGQSFPMELPSVGPNDVASIHGAILNSRDRVAPIEWKRFSGSGETIQYFLLSCVAWDSETTGGGADFDSVILAQDVTWIRESETAKSAFIGLLSHEVKTPVTSLLMATRLLQRASTGDLTAVQKKLVDSSVRDVERLRELIEEFFSASSFTLSADQMQFRVVDLRRILSQALRSVRAEAESRSVAMEFVFECRSSDALILADAPRVSWAISQLVTQGVRHAPKSSKISVQMIDEGPSETSGFQIVVRSPALFASESIRDRIFEKSFSRYDLRVARSDATGMSLAIAKEIAVGHGGSLLLNPDYQNGTEFIFTLPRRQGESVVFSNVERN
ncbi:sensor histidine kinase, partial [bacterium]|nr:sensor histidine kinase [bacterium]